MAKLNEDTLANTLFSILGIVVVLGILTLVFCAGRESGSSEGRGWVRDFHEQAIERGYGYADGKGNFHWKRAPIEKE